jgi:hypothetical protein
MRASTARSITRRRGGRLRHGQISRSRLANQLWDGWTYKYDHSGSIVAGGGGRFVYDSASRLKESRVFVNAIEPLEATPQHRPRHRRTGTPMRPKNSATVQSQQASVTERVWAGAIAGAALDFSAVICMSIWHGGFGVVFSDGEFVMRQGRIAREIAYWPGLVFWVISYLLVVLGATCLFLTAVVLVRRGGDNPMPVLGHLAATSSFWSCVLGATRVALFAPLLVLVVRLLFSPD